MEARLTRSGEEGVLAMWALTHGCRLTALPLVWTTRQPGELRSQALLAAQTRRRKGRINTQGQTRCSQGRISAGIQRSPGLI